MEKRYQVFVSSTYADLKEERQRVIQTLMEMDCIPSGMELFPAADEEQWEFIKKIIDDCDYYLLIIGGRYGSTTSDGISYTEKEYEYALHKEIKVIALLHENPDEIALAKSDIEPVLRERLRAFREKVVENRLVKFWKRSEELPGLVALSLSKTIKTYPAVGWMRADRALASDALVEINELRKENYRLKNELEKVIRSQPPDIENLASLEEHIEIGSKGYSGNSSFNRETQKTWREIFALISPSLLKFPSDSTVKKTVSHAIFPGYSSIYINDQDYETIKIQLMALKLVTTTYTKTVAGGMDLFWALTPRGQELMMQLRAVRTTT